MGGEPTFATTSSASPVASGAFHRFRAGAIWRINDPSLLAEAREEQDRRNWSDAWDDLIEHWLTHELGWQRLDAVAQMGKHTTGRLAK